MVIRYIFTAIMVLFLSGCSPAVPGKIYTNITLPYSSDLNNIPRLLISSSMPNSTDFNNTKVGTKHCILNSHSVEEPFSGYGVKVQWSTNQILSAARDAGITSIAYIDEQTLNILGIYTFQRLFIYGD